MDDKEFLKRLSEVSEWHRPQISMGGIQAPSKIKPEKVVAHPGPITEEELEEMSDLEVKQYYKQLMAWQDQQPNMGIAPEIKTVKIQPVDCEDCGRHCPEGRRVERKLHETGQRHWRYRCRECGLYRDPMTGQYTLTPQVAHQYLGQYYRPKLGLYKSKYQPKIAPKK